MCAYFLGKGIDANLDDLFPRGKEGGKARCLERCKEQLALNPAFDYAGCIEGCGGMRVRPGETITPDETEVTLLEEEPVVTEPTVEPEAGTDWLDNLIAGIFGKGFETVRGVGGRTREATFDVLARQGLLGTGAAKGVAQDIAWQTERGISDLMREMEQIKYGREQETMNMLLQWLFGMGGMWR